MAHDSSIIFITGGVRSGKSRFAENIAMERWQSSGSGQLHYIAAMQPAEPESFSIKHYSLTNRAGISGLLYLGQ